MKRLLFLALAALLALSGFAAPANAQSQEKITVFAAASLTEAFNAMAPAFTKKTGIAVTFSYGGSDTLATQIKNGAPADVFASANLAQMKVVNDAYFVNPPKTFAKNRLVLIAPKAATLKITTPAALAKSGVKVVLAAPTVPVGGYARATFAKLAGTRGYPANTLLWLRKTSFRTSST